jgi:multicomponent Na+:H+ antiporter subunit A
VDVSPAYHLDARAENVMALAAWALGAAFMGLARVRTAVAGAVARAGDRIGPRHWYGVALRALNRCSDRIHDAEVRDLRNSIAAVLVPTGVLVGLGFAFTPTRGSFAVGSVETPDVPILVLLVLCVAAAFTVVRDPGRLRPVLALSVLGFALAAVYAFAGAPDVALVAVLVETIFTLVFVGVFSRLAPPRGRERAPLARGRRRRNVLAGMVAGLASFAVIWATLSRTSPTSGDAAQQIALTREAHGGDVVTVILADFRGLDTMVEITVLAVAVIGVASLLRRGRSW